MTQLPEPIQKLLAQVEALKPILAAAGFKRNQLNVREGSSEAQRKFMTDIDHSVVAIDDVVYNGKYPIPIRIYHPRMDAILPVAFFMHGGGHVCGSVTDYDGVVRKIARSTEHIVISIEYRLSPEFA